MRELPESRYDLSTYYGRVLHTIQITDPRTLLSSSHDIDHARRTVARYRSGEISMSEPVWQAKKILDASVHCQTQEPIFLPFRMSCFVLTNLFVTAGMLTPNMKARGTVFWQWTNQSVNVAFNYANANKPNPLSTSQIVQSYFTAVVASCGVALGLSRVTRVISSPARRELANRLVPFVAVASAGVLNVFLMRAGEIVSGIDVYSPYEEAGESLGQSRNAAIKAVGETAASRVMNASPIMVIPPLILLALQRRGALSPRMVIPVNLLTIFATSLVALPLAIAVFPTRESISVDRLEEDIRAKAVEMNLPDVVFNRGM